jgi:hypothetical protein
MLMTLLNTGIKMEVLLSQKKDKEERKANDEFKIKCITLVFLRKF